MYFENSGKNLALLVSHLELNRDRNRGDVKDR